MAVGLCVGSSATLVRAYALPKQDFEGARAYVEALRQPGDLVLTIGLTRLPYRFHGADFTEVTSLADFERHLESHARAFVMQTQPGSLRLMNPQLAEAVASRCDEIERFAGSLLGGDVVVLRAR